jgi:ArsR family transcriptional regulator
VVIHQVLHYLDDPARAIREAARLVAPGGRLLVIDFAPHSLEFLREHQAHRRLGFAQEQVAGWLGDAGLDCTLTQELAPPKRGGDQLTVSLWLGQDPRVITDWPLNDSYSRDREVA